MKKPEYKSYRDTLRIACLLVLVCICGYYAPEFLFPGALNLQMIYLLRTKLIKYCSRPSPV